VAKERFLIMVVVNPILQSRGSRQQSQQPQMVRTFAALAVFTFLGAAVIALPGFAPKVEASESAVLSKADRLAVPAVPVNCSREVWPDLSVPCMQRNGPGGNIREARLVTARR
jgi:hypothetical protein